MLAALGVTRRTEQRRCPQVYVRILEEARLRLSGTLWSGAGPWAAFRLGQEDAYDNAYASHVMCSQQSFAFPVGACAIVMGACVGGTMESASAASCSRVGVGVRDL